MHQENIYWASTGAHIRTVQGPRHNPVFGLGTPSIGPSLLTPDPTNPTPPGEPNATPPRARADSLIPEHDRPGVTFSILATPRQLRLATGDKNPGLPIYNIYSLLGEDSPRKLRFALHSA